MADAKICGIEACGKKHYARGRCRAHYEAERKADNQFAHCAFEGCGGNSHWLANGRKGWCHTHYMRWHRHGSTETKLRAANGEPAHWIKAHIAFDGPDCLLWPFAKTKGYGKATDENGTSDYACRIMCESVNGPPPFQNADSAHSCGNGHLGCVHPKHLRWATKTQNALDRYEHGTMRLGANVHNAVLTEAMVLEARRLKSQGLPITQIASRLGGSYEALKQMFQGKSWSWLH